MMNNTPDDNTPHTPVPARPAAHPPLPWLLIVGLSSLSLLWPLTALLGFGGGGPRALTLIAVIAATWIGVVGFGRIPRPMLVLTLVGVGYGVISTIFAAVMGGDAGRPFFTYLVALVMDAFWGFLAGLIAFAVQQVQGPRGGVQARQDSR